MSIRVSRCRKIDDGFTLIELLVVILIIGVLAAIAIPTFLHQRTKAHDTAAREDLRQLAVFEEIYLTETGSYGTIATIKSVEPRLAVSSGITLSLVRWSGSAGFCATAKSDNSATTWWWDSQAGGAQPVGSTGCSVTLSGAPGDDLVG